MLNQAQLLKDIIYYPSTKGSEGWLIYYISRPLVGTLCSETLIPAAPLSDTKNRNNVHEYVTISNKIGRSFNDMVQQNPLVHRQILPELEKLLSNFLKTSEKPLPHIPQSIPLSEYKLRRRSESTNSKLDGVGLIDSLTDLCEEEAYLRQSLENIIIAAVGLFEAVDSFHLPQLDGNINIGEKKYEQIIEQYIVERLHDAVLFSRVCATRDIEDQELQKNIRLISSIDIYQVGVAADMNIKTALRLSTKIKKAVRTFQRMRQAHSPQDMIEALLHTVKTVTSSDCGRVNDHKFSQSVSDSAEDEKQEPEMTINADVLVSLLLIVIIRSSVKNLRARLIYMRYFSIIENTEGGEVGYALSTLEGVLGYIIHDSSNMQWHSQRNNRLWKTVKHGEIVDMQRLLEPDAEEANYVGDDAKIKDFPMKGNEIESTIDQSSELGTNNGKANLLGQNSFIPNVQVSALAHVFPFQSAIVSTESVQRPAKKAKRVSMDVMSSSSLSGKSMGSWTGTINSVQVSDMNEISTSCLSRVRTPKGESLLMLAILSGQVKKLEYLLGLHQYYSLDFVLQDMDNDGTSIMSAAVQTGQQAMTDILMQYLQPFISKSEFIRCLAHQDNQGRSTAHYLFHQPKLISRVGTYVDWRLKDRNGQTPLFALCRSYDHDEYTRMITTAITFAEESQLDGPPLNIDDHIDNKGNTLLHVVNDPQLMLKLLTTCNGDINALNFKKFTPLMVASRYGRLDMVKALFLDERIDATVKDYRGLSAVELAKDDEMRNRIDEIMLLSNRPDSHTRTTSIVRSIFVEDGSIRLLLKSAAEREKHSVLVTTCRRSLQDFRDLLKWLAIEHPASWLPSIPGFHSPFLIPSKPSRAVLHDIQTRLDKILKMLLQHVTFAKHEMLWEFFLVPDISAHMLAERTRVKAAARVENVREEYTPIMDVSEVEDFVNYARLDTLGMQQATDDILRCISNVRYEYEYFTEASDLSLSALCTLQFLPSEYKAALLKTSNALIQSQSSSLSEYHYDMLTVTVSLHAIITALDRPANIIGSMRGCQQAIDRQSLTMRRSEKWPLALLDDARHKMQKEAAEKAAKSKSELEGLAKELRYTQQTIASELAGWQETRPQLMRNALKKFVRKTVVTERARLDSLKRALRVIRIPEAR